MSHIEISKEEFINELQDLEQVNYSANQHIKKTGGFWKKVIPIENRAGKT